MIDVFEDYLQTRPIKQRIFQALRDNPYGLTANELVDEVWKGAHEPDWALNSLQVHMVHMRRAMRHLLPWMTVSSLRRSGRRYLLIVRRPRGDAHGDPKRKPAKLDDGAGLEGPQSTIAPRRN